MILAFSAMGTKLATNLMLTQLSLNPCTLETGLSCACMNPREALLFHQTRGHSRYPMRIKKDGVHLLITLKFFRNENFTKEDAKANPCLRAKEADVSVCGRQPRRSERKLSTHSFLSLGHFFH